MSLTEKYDRAREAKAASDPGNDNVSSATTASSPGDQDYDDGGQADEQTARVRAMIRADAARPGTTAAMDSAQAGVQQEKSGCGAPGHYA